MKSILRWRLAIAYSLLVILLGLAFYRVDMVANEVEAAATERSALLERESVMRANNLCVAGNELRAEIVAYLERFEGSLNGEFAQQECPPPPLELEQEHADRLEDQQQRRDDE